MRLPELNEDEHEALLLMCGFAVGAAMRDNDGKLGYSFLRLTNKLNEGNPNYVPYEIPEEEDEIAGKVP